LFYFPENGGKNLLCPQPAYRILIHELSDAWVFAAYGATRIAGNRHAPELHIQRVENQ
jgi:hypothetical protein